jgi:hypothetical protein
MIGIPYNRQSLPSLLKSHGHFRERWPAAASIASSVAVFDSVVADGNPSG